MKRNRDHPEGKKFILIYIYMHCSKAQCSIIQWVTIQWVTIQWVTIQWVTIQWVTIQWVTILFKLTAVIAITSMPSLQRLRFSVFCICPVWGPFMPSSTFISFSYSIRSDPCFELTFSYMCTSSFLTERSITVNPTGLMPDPFHPKCLY